MTQVKIYQDGKVEVSNAEVRGSYNVIAQNHLRLAGGLGGELGLPLCMYEDLDDIKQFFTDRNMQVSIMNDRSIVVYASTHESSWETKSVGSVPTFVLDEWLANRFGLDRNVEYASLDDIRGAIARTLIDGTVEVV